MPIGQRIGLTMVMMLSLLTMAASIVKMIASQVLSAQGPGDVWWANPSSSIISSGAEQSAVIILGSVPPLLAIFKTGFGCLRNIIASLRSYVSRKMSSCKLRSKLKSSGYSSENSSEPGQQRARSAYLEKDDLMDKGPNPTFSSSGNDSYSDLRARMDIWRTDSFVVTYEQIGSRTR